MVDSNEMGIERERYGDVPLDVGEFNNIFRDFRKSIRDSLTNSESEQSKPAPVPSDHYSSIVGMDYVELSQNAMGVCMSRLVAQSPEDVTLLMETNPTDVDNARLRAKVELIVNLLTAPVAMNRNRAYDVNRRYDELDSNAIRETEPMVKLNNAIFDYCIAFPQTSREDIEAFFYAAAEGASPAVKKQIPGTIQGVGAEVAVQWALKGHFGHGNPKEDLQGKDFVSVTDRSKYIDLKCKNRLSNDQLVEAITYVSNTHQLYIPPSWLSKSGPFSLGDHADELREYVRRAV